MSFEKDITVYFIDGTCKDVKISPINLMESIKITLAQEKKDQEAIYMSQIEILKNKTGLKDEEINNLAPYSFYQYTEKLGELNEEFFNKVINKKEKTDVKDETFEEIEE